MRRLLLILALTPAAFPVAARASDPVGRAIETSAAYWGNTPCGGSVSYQWDTVTPQPAMPGTEVVAWVTFESPLGPTNFHADPSTYGSCVVHLNRAEWPTEADVSANYPSLCQIMIHEYGHFEGYADRQDYSPADIRYPLMSSANMPTICRAAPAIRHFETRRRSLRRKIRRR